MPLQLPLLLPLLALPLNLSERNYLNDVILDSIACPEITPCAFIIRSQWAAENEDALPGQTNPAPSAPVGIPSPHRALSPLSIGTCTYMGRSTRRTQTV